LMLISLANNHIWESTYIDSLLTLFLSVCCIFSSFVRKLSFVRFCYESCLRFNFECKTKTHKSQERIELRFPSLCSEEQEVEEKPPGSQEKANCPDDKVNIADKFRAKLENVKENVRMPDGMRIRKKEKGEGGGEGKEEKKERSSEKKEKRREKQKSESRSNNYIKEDAEQEDGIRLSSLPNDPPGPLHSPESGNTSLHQV